MQNSPIRIGTRESQLAVWQARLVKKLLENNGHTAELVYIKSEGDVDLVTPLYAMGVQGVFTRSLDIALLNNKIDIAVHSMKDVPVQLPEGIAQAAVLKRANYKDILVVNWMGGADQESIEALLTTHHSPLAIATSSIRRRAQWLNRYPDTIIENLRGNVNTRLKKVAESNWDGAIFAAAGLERIHLRPENSIDLDWMLPAPAQGAIMIVAKDSDTAILEACAVLNDSITATCVKIERDFLSALMGGCSTPISALAVIDNDRMIFKGNITSTDGKEKVEVKKDFDKKDFQDAGKWAADEIFLKDVKGVLKKIA
ncbi:MAG: hydroxymethylbilane synthase [Niabella sp.]